MKSPPPPRILLFLACSIPALRLTVGALTGGLGADPVAAITATTGLWTLNLLFATLAITPLRRLTGWHGLGRPRRMLGLFAFFYACLHGAAYLVFEQFFDWAGMLADIGKRPFIAAGCLGFALMVPLAATSTDGMMRRLGGRPWRRLHRLAYLCALAAVLHYLWLVKRDITVPGLYALVLCGLLAARMVRPRRGPVPVNLPETSAPVHRHQ
ncbi:sulfite oxidase heme-binding subunit YedZ [Methylomagnum ishizawai]|uniref:sulfite oxidase heme-binding subunit YedZ n=1 Tax=Methylomagnum ishizawai TaxID=1760988 RepID=UPI001C32D440|nr:protein-methionine-sulfoxide reductase heme-binding subunit MsrQ [Methylomagnum ishizawai]BBL74506.1 protein-methionine-sulfoxide reductase heme-binding subunit MsrQ [Methylomagnum ishizawai]